MLGTRPEPPRAAHPARSLQHVAGGAPVAGPSVPARDLSAFQGSRATIESAHLKACVETPLLDQKRSK